jgi:DNA-binding response OmpR family regulator
MRVLLVDTEAQTISTIQRSLKSSGAVLEHVETGEDALRLAKRYNYDALIIDLMLPDTDGYEVLRRLHLNSIAVPVLILSSLTRPAAR